MQWKSRGCYKLLPFINPPEGPRRKAQRNRSPQAPLAGLNNKQHCSFSLLAFMLGENKTTTPWLWTVPHKRWPPSAAESHSLSNILYAWKTPRSFQRYWKKWEEERAFVPKTTFLWKIRFSIRKVEEWINKMFKSNKASNHTASGPAFLLTFLEIAT